MRYLITSPCGRQDRIDTREGGVSSATEGCADVRGWSWMQAQQILADRGCQVTPIPDGVRFPHFEVFDCPPALELADWRGHP